MKKYITATGMNHYLGTEFVKEGMTVKLVKEPDNKYDSEAIRVEMEGLGKIGYVANSTQTVIGESMSAGRLYDKFEEICEAYVKYVFPYAVLCVVAENVNQVDSLSIIYKSAFLDTNYVKIRPEIRKPSFLWFLLY